MIPPLVHTVGSGAGRVVVSLEIDAVMLAATMSATRRISATCGSFEISKNRPPAASTSSINVGVCCPIKYRATPLSLIVSPISPTERPD